MSDKFFDDFGSGQIFTDELGAEFEQELSKDQSRGLISEEISHTNTGFIERVVEFHDNYLERLFRTKFPIISNSFRIMEFIGPEQLGRNRENANKAFARAKYELKRFGGYVLYLYNEELKDFERLGIDPNNSLEVCQRLSVKITTRYELYMLKNIIKLDELWCLCHVKSFVTNDRKNSYIRNNKAREKLSFVIWYFSALSDAVINNQPVEMVDEMKGGKGNAK